MTFDMMHNSAGKLHVSRKN